MIFRQVHEPGRMGLSDFTDMGDLGVTVAGAPLDHRLYHFRLVYSGFEHAHVILGGESYVALAEGLQNALWALGGAPREHRSDSLSAAFRNLDARGPRGPDRRATTRCAPTTGWSRRATTAAWRTRTARSRAPTAISRATVADALLLRGAGDFDDLAAYRGFIDEIVSRHNARRTAAHRRRAGDAAVAAGPAHLRLRGNPRHRHFLRRLHPAQGVRAR